MKSKIAIALMLLVLAAAVMVGAYWYETKSENAKQGEAGIFVAQLADEPAQMKAVIIFCHEEKFQVSFEAFKKHLKLQGSTFVIPGGAKVFALTDIETPEELRPAKRTLIELLKRYSPARIILVSHAECLIYDSVAAWQDKLKEVKTQQMQDLQTAAQVIKEWFPHATVELFYADKSGRELRFLPIAIQPRNPKA